MVSHLRRMTIRREITCLRLCIKFLIINLVFCFPYQVLAKGIKTRNLHELMTQQEFRRSFGIEDSKNVPNYETFHLSENNRQRRQATLADRSLSFKALGRHFEMVTRENPGLKQHNQIVEIHHKDGKIKRVIGSSAVHTIGKLVNDENSTVALTYTDGVSGIINTKEEAYIIQPIPSRLRGKGDEIHDHMIFRSSDLERDASDEASSCGFSDKDERQYTYNEHRMFRRSNDGNKPKTMELLVAGDKSMVEFHGLDFLPTYLLATANIAAGLFQSTTLTYRLNVAVVRIVIFEKDVFNGSDSMQSLLGKWHQWIKADSTSLNYDDTNPLYADNAVLTTRNGCSGPCGIAGLAYTSLCGKSAQSINNDKGIQTALTMAHELGHNLHLGHDGSDDCPDYRNIMATSIASGPTSFEWSPCSARQISMALANDSKSTCFDDVPTDIKNNVDFQLYGQSYDADKQCAMAMGTNYKRCSVFSSVCSRMYCQEIGASSCVVTPHPFAHGTPCGVRQWCIQGRCVPDGTPDPMINGGWTDWSDYSDCNRDCGLGVQYRTRNCSNPIPEGKGLDCVGDSIGHFKTCQKSACPDGSPSFRGQQCTAKDSSSQPYVDAKNQCTLYCGAGGTGTYYGAVDDGTSCHTVGKSEICIQGKCRSIGCDSNIESGMVIDRCGVCGGDGSACSKHAGASDLPYSTYGEHVLVEIAAGSKNIEVAESTATKNFLGVKVGSSGSFLINLPAYSTQVNIGNAVLKYEMDDINYPDKITITGTVDEKITVYVANFYYGVNKGIQWVYYDNTPSSSSASEWTTTAWETCTATCAGGTQQRTISCRRMDDLSLVSTKHCDPSTKPDSTQACGEDPCPAKWNVGEFSECTASCGGGTRIRTISCCKKLKDGSCEAVADSTVCSGTKPTDSAQEVCNEISCPPRFQPGPWTACSKSCGGGTQTRTTNCMRLNATGFDENTMDIECINLAPLPLEQDCNIDVICGTWKIIYSTCSVSCGGGQQSPLIQCQVAGAEVEERLCSHETPPDISNKGTQACNVMDCNTYKWETRWGQCTLTCGTGFKTLLIECKQSSDNSIVAESNCDAALKPSTKTESCYEGECPIVYVWQQKEGVCDVTCGSGTIPVTVTCNKDSTGEVVADTFCDVATKPSTAPTVCSLSPCAVTHSWRVKTSADCSVTCGKGTHFQSTECVSSLDNSVVDDSKCDGMTKPVVSTTSCDMGLCPGSHSYIRSFTTCTATCGGGTHNEVYTCTRTSDGLQTDDSFCTGQIKPTSKSQSCNVEDCPGTYYWKETVGRCIPTCGDGFRFQVLHCTDEATQETVSNSSCKGIAYPPQTACSAKKRCVPVTSSAKTPPFYSVGCYREKPTGNVLPMELANFHDTFDWDDVKKTVSECAEKAYDKNLPFFAVNQKGICYGGDQSVEDTYFEFGESQDCLEGIGSIGAINILHFGSALAIDRLPPAIALGCYLDVSKPYKLLMADVRNFIDWTDMYQTIASCSIASRKWRRRTFGIEFYGECWTASNEVDLYSFSRDGKATNCYMGTGGESSYYVYMFATSFAS